MVMVLRAPRASHVLRIQSSAVVVLLAVQWTQQYVPVHLTFLAMGLTAVKVISLGYFNP